MIWQPHSDSWSYKFCSIYLFCLLNSDDILKLVIYILKQGNITLNVVVYEYVLKIFLKESINVTLQ